MAGMDGIRVPPGFRYSVYIYKHGRHTLEIDWEEMAEWLEERYGTERDGCWTYDHLDLAEIEYAFFFKELTPAIHFKLRFG